MVSGLVKRKKHSDCWSNCSLGRPSRGDCGWYEKRSKRHLMIRIDGPNSGGKINSKSAYAKFILREWRGGKTQKKKTKITQAVHGSFEEEVVTFPSKRSSDRKKTKKGGERKEGNLLRVLR